MNEIRCNDGYCKYVSANLCCKSCYIREKCNFHCANEDKDCSCTYQMNREVEHDTRV